MNFNVGCDEHEEIMVYEGDTAEELAQEISLRKNLDEDDYQKLVLMLEE